MSKNLLRMPLDYFTHAAGPAAQSVMHLNWVFTGICLAVCLLMAVCLWVALARKRTTDDSLRRSPYAIRWVYIGSGLSVIMLFGMMAYMLVVFQEVLYPPQTPALEITVTGYQWWWKADYKDFVTANEIHVPVGRPVLVHLRTADVIHAFWAPQLAGKTQMIPGQENSQWIEADRPGIYRGQCTQFCGAQHAHMAFEIVAETPAEFKSWCGRQMQVAAVSGTGEKVFAQNCGGCHAVRGTTSLGTAGPDLTHIASRLELAAGLMENTPQNLTRWITQAQILKPGTRMPNIHLSAQDKAALLVYLRDLK